MARYKIIDRSPRFLPVVLDAQLMSGSFEYALDYLIDHELDLSALDRRYRNDDTGSSRHETNTVEDNGLGVQRTQKLATEAARIHDFLAKHKERRSRKGAIRKSNTTDNDSAKMATSKGVIQGYTGVAAVDSRHQIIVAANALGSGSEQEILRGYPRFCVNG